MSVLPETKVPNGGAARLEWLPVLAGLLALWVPTIYGLATWLWQKDEHAHGPIILAIILWLVWQRRAALFVAPVHRAPLSGYGLLVFGLLIYVVGRSQGITLFEVGALAPILAGTLLAMRGWPALRAFWFPIPCLVGRLSH